MLKQIGDSKDSVNIKMSTPLKYTPRKVKEFLRKTGFPFEMKVSSILHENKWKIYPNTTFLDMDEDKNREIDLIAVKKVGEIDVYLIIECKFSQAETWIFISPHKALPRYYSLAKYTPALNGPIGNYKEQLDKFDKCIDRLHIFEAANPLCINYISLLNKKEGNKTPITESIYKTVKSTLHCAAEEDSIKTRKLYFSLTVFSGSIFVASYSKKRLKVEKPNYAQYYVPFESEKYNSFPKDKKKEIERFSRFRLTSLYPLMTDSDLDFDEVQKQEMRLSIHETYKRFKPHFVVEFISAARLKYYLSDIEGRIKKIDVSLWQLPEIKEPKEQSSE